MQEVLVDLEEQYFDWMVGIYQVEVHLNSVRNAHGHLSYLG